MSIFGKKTLSLEEILKGIENLSDEDKETLRLKMQPIETAEEASSDEQASNEQSETESTEETEEMTETEEPSTVEEAVEETPTESPEPEHSEEQNGGNYDEVIAAQNARIDSLESQISAFKETLEKVVSNQDKQNFGLSPKANFDDEETSSRMDSVLNGYAPRRANQYK